MGRADNLLLVEGDTDKRVVPELIEKLGVPWGSPGQEIVKIQSLGGYGELAAQFSTQLKGAGLKRLGILVDADEDPQARWRSLSAIINDHCPLPPAPQPGGFVGTTTQGIRLGLWMMPDNSQKGMLETFLLAFQPQTSGPLWAHTQAAADTALALGATFLTNHRDKALIHTWLAWQNTPGRQLHQALKENLLDPRCPYAQPFLAWFKALYQL